MEQDNVNFNIQQLEYYQQIQRRNTWLARALLLIVVMSMLGANMWMSQRNYETVIINVDQTRLAQVQIMEATIRRVKRLDAKIDKLEDLIVQQQDGLAAAE